MSKTPPTGPKKAAPPKSKKLPRKLPDDPVSRAVQIMREATEGTGRPKLKPKNKD